MNDAKDLNTIAAICNSPELNDLEVDRMLRQVSGRKSRRICEALLGRIADISLDEESRELLLDIRSRAEYRDALEAAQERRRRKESEVARRMIEQRDRGEIADFMVALYGIQGDLPLPAGPGDTAHKMAACRLFKQRLQQRLGDRWREFMPMISLVTVGIPDWREEGF